MRPSTMQRCSSTSAPVKRSAEKPGRHSRPASSGKNQHAARRALRMDPSLIVYLFDIVNRVQRADVRFVPKGALHPQGAADAVADPSGTTAADDGDLPLPTHTETVSGSYPPGAAPPWHHSQYPRTRWRLCPDTARHENLPCRRYSRKRWPAGVSPVYRQQSAKPVRRLHTRRDLRNSANIARRLGGSLSHSRKNVAGGNRIAFSCCRAARHGRAV